MTVCIAALCGEGEEARAVVAADHMVTSADFMEFEHPGSKIVELSQHALVMVAGATNDGMRLVHEAAISLGDSTADIAAIAENLGARYAEARLRRAEQFALQTRGLDLDSYYAMHSSLNDQLVMLLDNVLSEFSLGVDLLLAGVDDSGAHIHTNGHPGGGNQNHDSIGWTAIGSGAIHVVPSMAGFVHSAGSSYGETLFRVYASKHRAEVAPGVGHETDVAVISKDGIKRLDSAELERLDTIYSNFVSITDRELHNQLDDFDPEATGDAKN
jgi:20S proteasome alpha/beta subunit